MVALNFKARFADDVEQRIKRQTIRALRKCMCLASVYGCHCWQKQERSLR
jgi:hypothetical protein